MKSVHAHHQTPRWLLALLLAALATIGPFAVDTYMPAFGGMAQDLHATTLQMQQTLSSNTQQQHSATLRVTNTQGQVSPFA